MTSEIWLFTLLPKVLVIGLFFIISTNGQSDQRVLARVGERIDVTFNIPDTQEINSRSYVYILMPSDSDKIRLVFLLRPDDFSVTVFDDLKSEMTASADKASRTFKVTLFKAEERYAGNTLCSLSSSGTPSLDNCGYQLVVIKKPDPPVISVLPGSSLLVGGKLVLECLSQSQTLPADHGLASTYWWYDAQGRELTTESERFYVNSKYQLQVDSLERSDAESQFTCVSAEDLEGYSGETDDLRSDYSDLFTVYPEFAPTTDDLTLSSGIKDGDTVSLNLNEKLDVSCAAACNPACTITWMYQDPTPDASFVEVPDLSDQLVLFINGVTRMDAGHYQCQAKNEHSTEAVKKTFKLDVVYLELLSSSMNGENTDTASVWENEKDMDLQCVFDSNPAPTVTWLSPKDEKLKEEEAEGPVEVDWERRYTSSLNLGMLACDQAGIYTCRAANPLFTRTEDVRLSVNVYCAPSKVEIDELTLEENYAWELGSRLQIEFVIQSYPRPEISKIVSSKDGDQRLENIGSDFVIGHQQYNGKAWLTHFTLSSYRQLTMEDAGRLFTLTFHSSEADQDFSFRINPRGPPHQVKNITLEEITHESVEVFWLPGFDGGEKQLFAVEHRTLDEQGKVLTPWVLIMKDVPESLDNPNLWVEVKVEGLSSRTHYELRVMAYNELGNSTGVITMTTIGAPSGGLSGGEIFAIVFFVILFLLIVVFLLYWFVFRKRGLKVRKLDDGIKTVGRGVRDMGTGVRDSMRRLTKSDGQKTAPNGDVAHSKSSKNPLVRMKEFLNRPPKKANPDYHNVSVREQEDDDDDSIDFHEFDDGDYVNTDVTKPPPKDEVVYANASAINKHEAEKKNLGRTTNDDGLVYVSVAFANNNNNRAAGGSGTNNNSNSSTPAKEKAPIDDVDYSELDFTKMPQAKQVTAEVNPTLKDHEVDDNGYVLLKQTAPEAGSGSGSEDAPDGGAEDKPIKSKLLPEADFGTAV